MLLSVILPSLNVSKYIEQCVKSASDQLMSDIEILCIDAGSTDGTIEIIENLKKNDDRIQLIHSPIKSYGYQVNLGIKLAKGEYVAILETDDYVTNNMYKKLCCIAGEHNLDYAKGNYTQVTNIDENCYVKKDIDSFRNNQNIYNKVISMADHPEILLKDTSIWRGIYRRSFLLENNIWANETPGAAYQDIGFVVQVIIKARRAMYVKDAFYQYRCNRPGCSSINPDVLKFAYQEWNRLLHEVYADSDDIDWKTVFYRMQDVFVCELDKLLIQLDFNMEDEHISRYFSWFCDTLKKNAAGERCILIEKSRQLMESTEEYISDLRDLYICDIKVQKKIVDTACKFKSVIVFGAGIYGAEVYRLLQKNGIENVGFMDNSRYGEIYCGCKIVNPRKIETEYKDAFYIIAAKNYADDIKAQILACGISESNTTIYSRCL